MQTQERRRFVRLAVDRQVRFQVDDAEASSRCQIRDINFKGARICCAEKLERDTSVKIKLVLAEDLISGIIEAWIVWHKSMDGLNVYGIYFAHISDEDKEKIYRFMCRYFPQRLADQWWDGLDKPKGGETMQEEERFEDKRVFARFPAKLSMRCLEISTNREVGGLTQDISAKGVGLVTDVNLTPRSAVEVWLDIPDQGEPLYARGEVAWSKEVGLDQYRAGISLEKADFMGLSRVLRVTR